MDSQFAEIDTVVTRVEQLAEELQVDPDGHVRRSATELRAAFSGRGAIEPAVARMRESVRMLRRENQEGSRREFQRLAHGLDYLQQVVERELLPNLRRIGFEV
jgi:hypothetical protein